MPDYELTKEEIQDIISEGVIKYDSLGIPKRRQSIDQDISKATVAKVLRLQSQTTDDQLREEVALKEEEICLFAGCPCVTSEGMMGCTFKDIKTCPIYQGAKEASAAQLSQAIPLINAHARAFTLKEVGELLLNTRCPHDKRFPLADCSVCVWQLAEDLRAGKGVTGG